MPEALSGSASAVTLVPFAVALFALFAGMAWLASANRIALAGLIALLGGLGLIACAFITSLSGLTTSSVASGAVSALLLAGSGSYLWRMRFPAGRLDDVLRELVNADSVREHCGVEVAVSAPPALARDEIGFITVHVQSCVDQSRTVHVDIACDTVKLRAASLVWAPPRPITLGAGQVMVVRVPIVATRSDRNSARV